MDGFALPIHDTTGHRLVLRPYLPLHWVLTKRGRAVAVPCGRIALEGGGGNWRCVLYGADAEPITLVSGVHYRNAKETAEDYIRSIGKEKFADPDAPWRRRPASQRQIAVLRRRRVRIRPDMTAGEVSDRITSGSGRSP